MDGTYYSIKRREKYLIKFCSQALVYSRSDKLNWQESGVLLERQGA